MRVNIKEKTKYNDEGKPSAIFYSVMDRGKKVGHASVHFNYEPEAYDWITIPRNTAIFGAIEIQGNYRGRGYGTQIVKRSEMIAKQLGMKRMLVSNVDNPDYFVKKAGFYYTGQQRIFVKNLDGKPVTAKQRKQTKEYMRIFSKVNKLPKEVKYV